ncbi:hypothetical protein O9992_21745 [Vibrio lentus]|nr:hypothetical protein [Vibrio lentus]
MALWLCSLSLQWSRFTSVSWHVQFITATTAHYGVILFRDYGFTNGACGSHAADVSVWIDWRTWDDRCCGQ